MKQSFLGQRLLEVRTTSEPTALFFALELDLQILTQRLASAQDANDHHALAKIARSLANLAVEAGLADLATLARPLATVMEAATEFDAGWITDLTWLLDAAPSHLAARWPAHVATVPRAAQ